MHFGVQAFVNAMSFFAGRNSVVARWPTCRSSVGGFTSHRREEVRRGRRQLQKSYSRPLESSHFWLNEQQIQFQLAVKWPLWTV
jgi:hypothetical protein